MTTTASFDNLFRALSDPTRRAIFERIASSGEVTVSELTNGSGVTQGAVSQHLRTLKGAGLVVDRSEGRHVHYRIEMGGLAPLAEWMDYYSVFWRDHFNQLRNLIEEIDT